MQCKQCGNELDPKAKFCPSCGTPVEGEVTATPEAVPVPPPTASASQTKAEAPKTPWYATTPARIVIGLFGVFMLVSGIMKIVGARGPSSGPTGGGESVTITFGSGDADEGAVDPINATADQTITLPQNGFTYRNRHFAGWMPAGSSDKTVYQPGDQVAASLASKYVAVWDVEIGFDANGGEGSMDTVYVPVDDDYKLPACAFKRPGHIFVGWTTNTDKIGPGTPLYQAGDTWKAVTSVTFYARWEVSTALATVTIDQLDQVTKNTVSDLGGTSNGCLLKVTNGTDENVNVSATFRMFSTGGTLKDKSEDESSCVAPGNSVLLHCYDLKRSTDIEYEVTATKSEDWKRPLNGRVEVKERSLAADKWVVQITNPGPDTVLVTHCRCLLQTPDGQFLGGDSFATATLKPGESLEATFRKDTMFDQDKFTSFEDAERGLEVSGYAYTPHN